MHVKSHARKSFLRTTSVHQLCDRGDCRKEFSTVKQLQVHLRMHDNNLIYCFYCSWGGCQFDDYITHMNHHFHVRPFKCTFCDKPFLKNLSRRRHEERFHDIVKNRYKCTLCNFTTHASREWFQHKAKCTPDLP